MTIEVGHTATMDFTDTDGDTAAAVGSGDLAVLATPRLLAWAEAATCAVIAADLDESRSSVGTRVQLDHVAASPVGAAVSVTATASYVDGRLVRFEVVAEHTVDGASKMVGHGEVTRVIVDRERFLSRL